MAATDSAATLAEMQTDFLEKLKEATGVTAINTVAARFLNDALKEVHGERWSWAERDSTIRTIAPYSTGTVAVAVTNLTTRCVVTGTSTAWTSTNSFGDANAVVGYKIQLDGSVIPHEVLTVGGATTIGLDTTTPYMGSAALTAASYTLYQDAYPLATGFEVPIDMNFFDVERGIRLIGVQDFDRLYARNTRRGKPEHATIVRIGPGATAALRERIVFGPAPDAAYIIPYRYYTNLLAVSALGVEAINLTASTDEPIVPKTWRTMIVWKALELWAKSRSKNPESAALFSIEYERIVLRARARTTNADQRPTLVPRVSGYWAHRHGTWRRGTSGRRSTGTAFDELRDR